MKQGAELKVFISSRASTCGECKSELGTRAWIFLAPDRGALCLACADLDHLEFLPCGDHALTVRSRKYSTLSAVVLKWSRSRKRYERQGLLVERPALERAEQECLGDAAAREQRRARAEARREEADREYVEQFARRIRELFPGCPVRREEDIADHACRKYSGRVGRCAAARDLDPEMIELAVRAHIRHALTRYDELLAGGCERHEARATVEDMVRETIHAWRNNEGGMAP
jgi:hypothetical protein